MLGCVTCSLWSTVGVELSTENRKHNYCMYEERGQSPLADADQIGFLDIIGRSLHGRYTYRSSFFGEIARKARLSPDGESLDE